MVVMAHNFCLALLVFGALCSAPAEATRDEDWTLEDEEVLRAGYGPDPDGVPLEFRCAWRQLLLEYARQLRPDSVTNVHDALLLASMCNSSLSEADKAAQPIWPPRELPAKLRKPDATPLIVYVDANKGDDSNTGMSVSQPKKTIAGALVVTRKAGPGDNSIMLRAGTYYLANTIELSAADSGLSIVNYPGEKAWISGGRQLTLQWKPHDTNAGNNIYVASVEAGPGITGLRVNGRRVPRARRPNADPETQAYPAGWFDTSTAKKWLPMANHGPATDVQLGPVRNITGMFEMYGVGIGGPCSHFTPPVSYWCQKKPAGGGGFEYYVPSGMTFDGKTVFSDKYGPVHGPWKNVSGAVAHVWRRAHWSNWMFAVDEFDPKEDTLKWTLGGFQGSRGGPGSDWYIENVFQELDAPGEWYYDAGTSLIYYFNNASSGTPPAADMEVVATNLQVYFNLTGTQSEPVKNVTFNGIGFRDAAYTYLSPHGVPSGGDWGLERYGALFLQGTEHCLVNASYFERMDGNVIMLSGYNQYTVLSNNEFAWTGDSVMVAWGITDELSDGGKHGNDGTDGNFPRYTQVLYNIVRETGIWEKQSSAWFQAKSAQSILRGNIIYNLARAGVNINDGFGGGNDISENIVFNTCRESSDHGPINSWDRQPFLTLVNGGNPGVIPLTNEIHNNFLVSNYGGVKGGVDNDDGSILYANHDNFEIYGWGLKNGIGCGDHRSYNNVHLYLSIGYRGHTNFFGREQYADQMYNETWLFGNGSLPYLEEPTGCNVASIGKTFQPPITHDNTLYKASGSPAIQCGRQHYTVAEWQQQTGLDKGTTLSSHLPTNDELMNMGRHLLNMPMK